MKKTFLISICLLLLCSNLLFATDRTWTGAGAGGAGTVFNAASNWSPAGTPSAADALTMNLTMGSSVTLTLSGNITVGSLTVTQHRGYAATAITDILNLNGYTLTASGNFSISNENMGFNPSSVTINVPSSSTLNIGGNFSVVNTNSYAWFMVPISSLVKQTTLNNMGTVNVTGATVLSSENMSSGTSAVSLLIGNSPASYNFTGNVTLDDGESISGNTIIAGAVSAGATGKFVFKANLTLGAYAQTNSFFTAGTTVFDAPVSQTVTYHTVNDFNPANIIIGSTNSPVVSLAGKTGSDDLTGDLTLNNASVLDLGTSQWNRATQGGTFRMNGTSTLKLAGSSSVKNGTAATIAGSNFPSGFASYSMDLTNNCASVVYYGANQTIFGGLDYGSLILSGSGTITAPAGTITLYKNFNKSSSVLFKHNNGTIIFTGNYNPKIYAAAPVPDFYNLNFAGGNPELINEIGVVATLTLNMSNFNIQGNINLRSTAAQTANVVYTSGNINYGTGRFVVERYISSGRKWRFLAVPANGENSQTIRSAWQEGASDINANPKPGYGMQVTDDRATWNTTGFDAKSLSGPSIKYWNGTGYTGIPSTTQPLQNLSGYNQTPFTAFMCFVRGDRTSLSTGATVSSTTLRTTGKIFTGNLTVSIPSGNVYAAIGNPYASAIDLRKIVYSGVAANAFYVWDPKLTGTYGLGAYQTVTLNGSNYTVAPGGGSYGSGGSINNFIQSGAAFFVKGTGGSLTFKESAKDNSSAQVMRGTGDALPMIRANLSLKNGNEAELLDGAGVIVDDSFSNNADNDDAAKMANTSENVSIRQNGVLLAVERRKMFVANDTMFLNLTGLRVADYQWNLYFDDIQLRNCTPFLADKFLNTVTPLSVSDSNFINFSIQNIAGSYAADRFMIIFKPSAVLPVSFVSVNAVRNNDKAVTVKWQIENEINISRYNVEYSADGRTFAAIGTVTAAGVRVYSYNHTRAAAGVNYYRIRAEENSGSNIYSAVVKVTGLNETSSISVYPNPVENKQMNVAFTKQAAGTYNLRLVDEQGRVVYTKSVTISGTSETRAIALGNIATGSYQLSVSGEKGIIGTESLFVK